MSEKPAKHKKGFMSRLSSFRKKKSSSKQGSAASLQSSNSSGSGQNEVPGKKEKKGEESGSPTSSATNSLEGLNGRTRSTSDLIDKFEKRLSGRQDDQERAQRSSSETRTVDANSTFTVDSSTADKHVESNDAGVRANKPVSQNVNNAKQTSGIKSTPNKFKGGIRPYQSVFSDDECPKFDDSAMSSIQENADNTTQTEFSTPSENTDDDVARLVKVQSAKTPEMRRAQLSVTANYCTSISTCSNSVGARGSEPQPSRPKETFIGPDLCSPLKAASRSQSLFQSTSTPMPGGPKVTGQLKSSHSPISVTDDNLTSSNISQSGNVGQPSPAKEVSISHVQSRVPIDENDSSTTPTTCSSISPTKPRRNNSGDVWERQSVSDSDKHKMGLSSVESKKQMNSTYVKPPNTPRTMPTPASKGIQPSLAASGVNQTVILERSVKSSTVKTSIDRTFSLDSAGAGSLGSDDLMCDSRFAGMDESAFSESQTSYSGTPTRPIALIGHERTRSFDHRRKGSEDSVSSSLPSTSSMFSSFSGRSRMNSVDKDSMVIVEASMYNSMVRDLAAMRLALLKLNTMLVDAGGLIKKTRSSGVQCEMMWDKASVDTQTGVTEPIRPAPVTVASVQCSLHPPRVSCSSQYEKPKELPKPSKLSAPSTTKLAKPRTSQAKETGAATESRQVSDSTEDIPREQLPVSNGTDAEDKEPRSPPEEKRDGMKNGDQGRSVEIQVQDAGHGVTKIGTTSMDGDCDLYLKEEIDHLDNASQDGWTSGIDGKPAGSRLIGQGGKIDALVDTKGKEVLSGVEVNNSPERRVGGLGPVGVTVVGGDQVVPGTSRGEKVEFVWKMSQQDKAPKSGRGRDVSENEGVGKTCAGEKITNHIEGNKQTGFRYMETKLTGPSDRGKLMDVTRGGGGARLSTLKDDTGVPVGDGQSGEKEEGRGSDEQGIRGEPDGDGNIPKISNNEKKGVESLKAAKLQGPKSTNLRFSQNAKTDRPPATGGNKLARPQGGLRPPQAGRLEVTSKVSTTKIVKTVLHPAVPQNSPRKISPSSSASGLKPPSVTKHLGSNVAVVKPIVKEAKGQTGLGPSRPPPKNQNTKLQRVQRSIPQSKLARPASYSNIPQKDVVVEPMKRASLTDSNERMIDDNGNTSTTSLPENIVNGSKESRLPAGATRAGNTRLPKAKSTSRLPRGGGVPKMTRR